MTKICSSCSVPLDANAQFCAVCGTPAEREIHCPDCGGTVESAAAFCKYCAPRLDSTPADAPENALENPASLISPSGAAFAAICFFLPWTQVSCGERTVLNTGADLGGAYWFIPFLAVVAFAAYFICKYRKTLYAARPFIIGAAIIALTFFGHVYYSLHGSKETQIKYGYFGSLVGFVLAMAGCFFISRKPRKD